MLRMRLPETGLAMAALATVLSGCFGQLEVPAETQLTCTAGEKCPTGWTCVESIRRCVKTEGIDTNAPSFSGTPTLTPTVLRSGAAARLTFKASEQLFDVPVVKLKLPGGDRPLTLITKPEAFNGDYVFEYIAQGTEPEDPVDYPVEVVLTDTTGSVSGNLSAGGLRFDFTAARVSQVNLNRAFLSTGQTAILAFTLSEQVSAPPVVRIANVGTMTQDTTAVFPLYRYRYQSVGPPTEPTPAAGERPSPNAVEIDVEDLAGNKTANSLAGQLYFDFDPPKLTAPVEVLPSSRFARAGSVVRVKVSADELLGDGTSATIGPAPMVATRDNTGAYVFSYTVLDGQNGDAEIKVTLVDVAGNSVSLPPETVAFDTTVPQVAPANVVVGPYKSPSTTPSFTLNFNEPMATATVTVAGQAASCSAVSQSMSCSYSVPAGLPSGHRLETDGPFPVVVEMTDRAGNPNVVTVGAMTFDFTAPKVKAGNLELVADPNNPALAAGLSVSALKVNSTARFFFQTSETLSALPVVRATQGANALAFTQVSGVPTSTTFLYAHVLAAGPPSQGVYAVEVAMTDRAGNVGTDTFTVDDDGTQFVIDTVAPALPDTTKLVYKRWPWGDSAGGAPKFTLEGTAGAVEAGGVVVPMDGSRNWLAPPKRAEVDGSFTPILLSAVDRRVVYLAHFDGAGNFDVPKPNPPTMVRNVEWTATLGQKLPGSLIENPHTAAKRPVMFSWLEQEQQLLGKDDGIAAMDAQIATVRAHGYFRKIRTGGRPPDRSSTPLVYDSVRGVSVMFGGAQKDRPNISDTWEWNGIRWQEVFPADPEGDGNPGPRQGHMMTFDSARGKVLMFGGNASGALNELWEYDGNSWKLIPTTGTWPVARSNGGFVYDTVRGVVILFGGAQGATVLSDLWEYNPSLRTWSGPLAQTGSAPGLRRSHQFVQDPTTGEIILFGGNNGAGNAPLTTYRLMPGSNLWTNLVNGPVAQSGANLTYDRSRSRFLLYGASAQTWELNNAVVAGAWTDRTGFSGPASLTQAGIAYDESRRRVVMFGGNDGGGTTDYTWEWNGATGAWVDLSTPTSGGGYTYRTNAALAFHGQRGVAVMFGGNWDFTPIYGDTLEFDGVRWQPISITDPEGDGSPGALGGATLVSDPRANGRMVMFGGEGPTNQLWEYKFNTSTFARSWDLLTPGGTIPSARMNQAMAFDVVNGRYYLFGGTTGVADAATTYHYSFATNLWTASAVGGAPAARSHHGMVYDSVRARLVLFGGVSGGTLFGDTWEYNPAAPATGWVQITPTDPEGDGNPAARLGHVMFYDLQRGRTVLFGGSTSTSVAGPYGDAWEWNGQSWRKLDIADPYVETRPVPRSLATGAFDSVTGQALIIGGRVSGQTGSELSDTWLWNGNGGGKTGQFVSFAFGSAQADDPVDSSKKATLSSVTATVSAGGVSFGAGTQPGYEVRWFEQNDWKLAGAVITASGDQVTAVSQTFTNNLSRMFYGPQKTLNLSITTRGPNGAPPLAQFTESPRVHLDYAELTVRYTVTP